MHPKFALITDIDKRKTGRQTDKTSMNTMVSSITRYKMKYSYYVGGEKLTLQCSVLLTAITVSTGNKSDVTV